MCVCVRCVVCMMCVLRERVRGEKSVNSEHNFESLHLLPQKTTGVFCRDPQSHCPMGWELLPTKQSSFLLSCSLGQLGLSRRKRGKVKGNEVKGPGVQHRVLILSPCYRLFNGSWASLVASWGQRFPDLRHPWWRCQVP